MRVSLAATFLFNTHLLIVNAVIFDQYITAVRVHKPILAPNIACQQDQYNTEVKIEQGQLASLSFNSLYSTTLDCALSLIKFGNHYPHLRRLHWNFVPFDYKRDLLYQLIPLTRMSELELSLDESYPNTQLQAFGIDFMHLFQFIARYGTFTRLSLAQNTFGHYLIGQFYAPIVTAPSRIQVLELLNSIQPNSIPWFLILSSKSLHHLIVNRIDIPTRHIVSIAQSRDSESTLKQLSVYYSAHIDVFNFLCVPGLTKLHIGYNSEAPMVNNLNDFAQCDLSDMQLTHLILHTDASFAFISLFDILKYIPTLERVEIEVQQGRIDLISLVAAFDHVIQHRLQGSAESAHAGFDEKSRKRRRGEVGSLVKFEVRISSASYQGFEWVRESGVYAFLYTTVTRDISTNTLILRDQRLRY